MCGVETDNNVRPIAARSKWERPRLISAILVDGFLSVTFRTKMDKIRAVGDRNWLPRG